MGVGALTPALAAGRKHFRFLAVPVVRSLHFCSTLHRQMTTAADKRYKVVGGEGVVGGGEDGVAYLQEEATTYLQERFTKMKPIMKLAGINNPQFTEQDDGPWSPPLQLARLNHAAVAAVDVDAVCRFYCKVLGFRKIKGGGNPEVLVHIIQRDPSVPRRMKGNWKEQYECEPEAWYIRRSNHLAFEIECDFEAAERTLQQHGIEYSRHVLPEAGTRQLFFYDPEGNGIEIGCFDSMRAFFSDHGEAPRP